MQVATSSEVRAWAVSKGLAPEGVNIGRISKTAAEAFNKAHKAKAYDPKVKPARTLTVKVGRKTVKVDSAVLREGIDAGKRGRVNAAKAAEFVIGAGLV